VAKSITNNNTTKIQWYYHSFLMFTQNCNPIALKQYSAGLFMLSTNAHLKENYTTLQTAKSIHTDIKSSKIGIFCRVEDVIHAAGELLKGRALHQLLVGQRRNQGAPLSLPFFLPLSCH
jgi:hypothetical protein